MNIRPQIFRTLVVSSCAALLFSVPVRSDEGMWTFDNPPLKQLQEKYHFTPTPQWLDHIRLSCVRLNDGGSGSFVSAHGLLLTNHHVARGQLTARQLSKYHPSAPIFALSPVEVTINRLNLLWGTTPIRCPKVNTTEALVDCAEQLLEQGGYVRPGEVIAIVAGTRTKSGSTNFLRLHVMGEHNQEGVRFFAPKEEESVPVPGAEAPASTKRPAPKAPAKKN